MQQLKKKSRKNHHIKDHIKENSEKYRSYRRFLRGISSESTKETYAKFMKNFMEFCKLDDYDKTAQLKTEAIDEYLEDYIDYLDSKGNKGRTVRTNMAGIERFFVMNDCIWHEKRIRHSVKKDTEAIGGKIPITTEELIKMLKCTKSLRTIAIVHFLSSTGVRPAALVDPILCIKHLVRLDDCYAIKVYDESIEGYWVFLTPEATNSLDDYFQWRKSKNEKLDDDSPIFAIIDKRSAKGNNLTEKNLRYIIGLLISMAGIKRTKVNKHRYDKAIVYMFRKRFNGILKMKNEVNSNIAEKLMAHKKGLDGVYLEPTRDQCFIEFKKAISQLTVDPAERQKIEIQKKQERITELEEKEEIIDEQKQQLTTGLDKISSMEQQIKELQEKNQREIEEKNTLAANNRDEKTIPLSDKDLKEWSLTIPQLKKLISDEISKKKVFENTN